MNAIEESGAARGKNLSPRRSGDGSLTVPLGTATSGRLVFTAGAVGVTLLAEPGLPGLVRCRFARRLAWVGFEAGILMVGYRPDALPPPDGLRPHAPPFRRLAESQQPGDEISLNASLPWEIEFRGVAARITARISGLQLRSLDVLGGASQVILELSKPAETTYLYLAGGASQVTIQRPPGVGVGLTAQGGIAGLSLDGQQFRRLPSDIRLESTGFDLTSSRYEISIAGGANQVTINHSIL